jgi:hypothetical protein
LPTVTLKRYGDVQAFQAFASRLHWKVTPASFEVNLNLTFWVNTVLAGFLVIVVSGATVSAGVVGGAGGPGGGGVGVRYS